MKPIFDPLSKNFLGDSRPRWGVRWQPWLFF